MNARVVAARDAGVLVAACVRAALAGRRALLVASGERSAAALARAVAGRGVGCGHARASRAGPLFDRLPSPSDRVAVVGAPRAASLLRGALGAWSATAGLVAIECADALLDERRGPALARALREIRRRAPHAHWIATARDEASAFDAAKRLARLGANRPADRDSPPAPTASDAHVLALSAAAAARASALPGFRRACDVAARVESAPSAARSPLLAALVEGASTLDPPLARDAARAVLAAAAVARGRSHAEVERELAIGPRELDVALRAMRRELLRLGAFALARALAPRARGATFNAPP